MNFKKPFSKVSHLFPQILVLFSVLTSNIFFPAVAIAEEISDLPSTNTQVEEEYPIDTSEDILDEGISTSIYEEEIVEEADEPLFVYEDGVYTVNTVVEGEEYVYPDNENVRITFNEVTEEGNLVIKRVELTDEQREELNTTDVYGWDISSTMSNGSFRYDLTLPNTQGDDVEVKYTEDGSNYESVDDVSLVSDTVVLRGLDHFTTFVVVNPLPGTEGDICTVSGNTGECYDTIQEAIDAASDGEEIYVDSSYDSTIESFPINVNKSVKLFGTQKDVDPRPSTGGRTGAETIVDAGESSGSVFRISVSGVVINGFTVTGGTADMIEESGSADNLSLSYNIIYDDLGSSGDEGVQIKYSDGVVIEYNYVYNIVQDALNLSSSTNGYVRFNEVHDIHSDNAAIYCYDANNINIENNLVYNVFVDDGIKLGDSGDGSTGGSVSNNIVYNVVEDGITIYASSVVVDGNEIYNVESENGALYLYLGDDTTITNNKIYDNTAIGILLYKSDNVTISGNEIYSNNDSDDSKYSGSAGIWIHNNTDGSTININNNEIYDNADYGILNLNSNLVNAQNNYWGDNGGPLDTWSGDGSIPDINSGIGNSVKGAVDYSNWLTVDNTPPSVPTHLSPTDGSYLSSRSFLADWSDSTDTGGSGLKNYDIEFFYNGAWRDRRTVTASQRTNTASYDLTWDWRVRARDNAGNVSDWSNPWTVTLDTNKPTIEIISPPENSIHNGTFDIKVKGEDTLSGIGQFVVNLKDSNGAHIAPCVNEDGGGTASYTVTCSLDTTAHPDGEYQIKTNVRDKAGNLSQTLSRTFYFDNSSPDIKDSKMFVKRNGNWIEDSLAKSGDEVKVWVEVEDEFVDVDRVQIWIREYPWNPNNNELTSGNMTMIDPTHFEFIYTVPEYYKDGDPINEAFEGNYFNFRPWDTLGNSHIGWRDSFTIDNTAPITPTDLTLFNHEGLPLGCSGYTNNRNITIDWADNTEPDIDYYILDLKDKDGHKELTVSEYDARIRDIDDYYKYKIRAVDYAGNISEASDWCGVTLDRIDPIVDITSHEDGDWVRKNIDVKGTASDLNLWRYWFVIENKVFGNKVAGLNTVYPTTSPIFINYPWDTKSVPDGQYIAKLEARDKADNKDPNMSPVPMDPEVDGDSVDWVVLNVDNTRPEAEITDPTVMTYTNDTITFSGRAKDANLRRIWLLLGDETGKPIKEDDKKVICSELKDSDLTNPDWNDITCTDFDVSSYPDGTYSMVIEAWDMSWNYRKDHILFELDRDAPDTPLGISIYQNGENLGCGGYVNERYITIDWDDNTELDLNHYDYQIREGNTIAQPTVSEFSGNIRDEDGYYKYRVRAIDHAGNPSDWTDWCGVTLDRVEPDKPTGLERRNTEGEVFACGDIAYRETMIPQWNDITDDPSFSHFEYSSFHPNGSQGLDEKVLYVPELMNNWTAPEDGTYGFAVRSIDKAGNKSEWSLTGESLEDSCQITYDSTPPEIVLESPNDGEVYAGEIDLKATCNEECDYINFWWWRDDQTIQNAIANKQYHYVHTNGTSFTWTLDSLNPEHWDGSIGTPLNGNYTLRAAGKDLAGNRTVEDISITIDNTPPSKPTGEYWIANGDILSCNSYTSSYNIIAEWEDSTDDVTAVSHYEYQSFNPDDGWIWPNINYGVEAGDSFRPGAFTVGEGTYGFRVRAVDMAGNKSDWSVMDFDSSCKITYDATAPIVEITNPSDTDILSGTVDITGYVTDDNLSHYNISIYNEGVDTNDFSLRIEQNTEYTSEFTEKTLYTWDTTNGNFPDGVYQIRLAARDLAGNRELGGDSEQIIEVTVDNTPPVTTLNEAIEGVFTNEPILIEGGTTDALSGVDYVNLYYNLSSNPVENWILIDTIPTVDNPDDDSPFEWDYLWTPDEEGTYDIKASGTDTLGNEEQSAYIYALTYDTTPPSITIFDIVADILNVNADDVLSGTEKIEIKIDDGQWMTYTSNMNLNDLLNNEPGTYTIHIRVTDKAGNITEDSTTYTIPEPPAEEDEGDVEGAADQRVVYAADLGTGTGAEIETEVDVTEDETTDEEVLGEEEQTCENPRKTYGYIYHDKNTDGKIDDNEDRLEGISLRIYYMENGEEMTVVELQTDEQGYWETELCPGEYSIEIDQETLPNNLETPEVLSLTVEEEDEEIELNISATDSRNFWQKYWYLILLGIGVLLTTVYLILSKDRQKEQTYQ